MPLALFLNLLLWGPPNIKEVEVKISEDLENNNINRLVTCIVCSFMCGLVNWCIMCFY